MVTETRYRQFLVGGLRRFVSGSYTDRYEVAWDFLSYLTFPVATVTETGPLGILLLFIYILAFALVGVIFQAIFGRGVTDPIVPKVAVALLGYFFGSLFVLMPLRWWCERQVWGR